MKIVQFGEGNFLRTFVDLYFDTLNKEHIDNYEVSIIKSVPFGSLDNFIKQNNKYHVVLRGRKDNENVELVYEINSIKEVIDLFSDSEPFFKLASDKDVKIIVSNTTEAGIVFDANDKMENYPNVTYPAKLTIWLYQRYKNGLPGVYILPVELIDNNANELFKDVDKYISLWNLEEEFRTWNKNENYYCNTLVDRIVSGYPKDDKTKEHLTSLIGVEDRLMSIGEPFGLWVIEDKGDISKILKNGHHNIDVIFSKDITYFKKRKVRVLNGSHTNMVPIALWYGKETVYDVMNDEALSKFVNDTLNSDIIPFVSSNIEETISFANDVKERFMNPFLNHQLTSIALNTISKWKARVLPSFIDYYERHHSIPTYLTKGFAYLVNMYSNIEKVNETYICYLPSRVIEIKDEEKYLNYFKNKTIHSFLSDKDIWGVDLTSFENFETRINNYLVDIKKGNKLV